MTSLPSDSSRTWTGWSGRHYPVHIHRAAEFSYFGRDAGIALAVSRDQGIALIIGNPVANPSPAWLSQARSAGATEIHLHQPNAVSGDPRAIVDDLRGSA